MSLLDAPLISPISIANSSAPVLRRNDTIPRASIMESSFLEDISEIHEVPINRNINDELNSLQHDLSRISQGRIFDTGPIDEIMQDTIFTTEERNEIYLNDKIINDFSSRVMLENYILSKCESELDNTKNNKIWNEDVREKFIGTDDWDYLHHDELKSAFKKF